MNSRARENSSKNELQFELKYCERCGGLWLRPVEGGQIYCMACSRAMAQLPAASHVPDTAGDPRVPRWGVDADEFDNNDGFDFDPIGGVA